jgi:hypothetical protein
MSGFIFNIVDVVIKSIGADIIKKFDDEIGKILEFLKDNDYDKAVDSLSKIAPNFVKVLKGEIPADVITKLAKRVTENTGADSISFVCKPPPPGFGPSISFNYNKQNKTSEES